MFPREVTIIKVEAGAKRDTMAVKDNTLTDHSVKQAASTKVTILNKLSKDKFLEGFKEATMEY